MSLIALLPYLAAAPAHAEDTWTTVRTGVELLHRTTADPHDIWAARIDLSQENIALHASSDTPGVERAVDTRTFAQNTGAVVAINTDWSDGSTPVGLAISDGFLWNAHIPNNSVGGQWGFVGCTLEKDCTVDQEAPLDVAWWFSDPTGAPYRFHHATGANGVVMVHDGVPGSGCYDGDLNPRSAICMEEDGAHMWMIAVDGRRSDAPGMTCDDVRSLMLELGCWDGAMLDGGGSTTLVVDGEVVNRPSDGSPRTVSNHLGVLVHDVPDAACGVANGRFCEGTAMRTCQGGVETAYGDCAAYGATCEEDGDHAYCVDPRCPGGDGQAGSCLDGTRIEACSDGRYTEGDCAAFGLVCGSDAGGTSCMDPACEEGPNGSFCTAEGQLSACSQGALSTVSCSGEATCTEFGAEAVCLDPECSSPDEGTCEGNIWVGCTDGAFGEQDCAAEGLVCDADAGGCVTPDGGGTGGGTGPGWDDPPGSVPTTASTPPPAGGCGCAGVGAATAPIGSGLAVLALGLLAVRRRSDDARGRRRPRT